MKKIAKKEAKPVIDSTDVVKIISTRPGLSNRDIKETLAIVRDKLGRQKLNPNLRNVIRDRSNLLQNYFLTEDRIFINNEQEKVNLPITFIKDINQFVKKICNVRNENGEKVKVILGLDGGQGKIIVPMYIVKNENPKYNSNDSKNQNIKYKPTGTHRSLIAARVDSIPENYHNLKTILDTLNLPELSQNCQIVCDLKVINILLGLQSCSSMHPCPYCMGYKTDKNGLKTNQKGRFHPGKPRTLGNIQEWNVLWGKETNYNRSLPKKYFNAEYSPIFVKPEVKKLEVYLIYPPPHLHTGILGPGNDTMKHIEKYMDLTAFRSKYNMKGHGPGGDLNGPVLKDLMNNKNEQLDELDNILKMKDLNLCLFSKHLRLLGHLNYLANAKNLNMTAVNNNLQDLRENFFHLQEIFNISESLKMHIIFYHYDEYFEKSGETFLGVSDEITESVHSRYRQFEEKHGYVSNKKGTKGHRLKQHKSVVHFNSLNIGDI